MEHSALTLALAVAGASSADSVLQSSQERSRCLGVRCRRTTGPAWLGAGASETSVLDRFTSSRTCTCSSPFTPTRSIASRSRGPARTSGSRGPMETQRPPCSSNTGFHVSKPRTLCCAKRVTGDLDARFGIESSQASRAIGAGRRSSSRPAAPARLRTPRRSGAQTQTVTCALCTSSAEQRSTPFRIPGSLGSRTTVVPGEPS